MRLLDRAVDPRVVEKAIDMGISVLNPWPGIARRIPDNKTLKKFLQASKAKDRKQIYSLLLPHLGFKPKPFLLLK